MVHLKDLEVYLQFPGSMDRRVSLRVRGKSTLKGIAVHFSPVA